MSLPNDPQIVAFGEKMKRQTHYKKSWHKFAAFSIDSFVVLFLTYLSFVVSLYIIRQIELSFRISVMTSGEDFNSISISLFLIAIWLYFSGMTSCSKQATLGKLSVGTKTTGLNGGRLTFWQASREYGLWPLVLFVLNVFLWSLSR